MSIDTINEKLSLISLGQPWNAPMPISDDGIGQDDKQHLLAGYPGVLWAEEEQEGSQGISVLIRHRTRGKT